MTVANFLSSSHFYEVISNVDDVQDILDALPTTLKTTNSPVWTEPVAGTYQSPVDAVGRYFKITPTRVDVDTLQIVTVDRYGTTIGTRRVNINTDGDPPVDVRIYSGQFHFWLDSVLTTIQHFRSGILDLSPQAQDAWAQQTFCHSHLDSAGNASSNTHDFVTITGSSAAAYNQAALYPNATSSYGVYTDPLGNNIYWPAFFRIYGAGMQLGGRAYQCVIGPASLAYGSEVNVAIDTGVVAKFRVSGSQPAGPALFFKLLVRAD